MTASNIAAASPEAIERGAEIIGAGGLVAMPTETVYGLAADATNDAAVARIYEAKGRPRFNPLISHVTDAAMAARVAAFNSLAEKLAEAFWPGALTLVLPRRADCALSLLTCAGLDTAALRAPAHPVAQSLIAAAGRPLAAPSANPSGAISPTRAEDVAAGLGDRVDLILDGGACAIGVESTVISLAGPAPALLRPGGIAREEIEAVIGPLAAPGAGIASPGQLASHYAPRARLRLDAKAPEPDEAFLGFGSLGSHAAAARNLSPSGDLREAAANLFRYLRELDESGAETIAVAPIPNEMLGEAINDRLRRAAAPRQEMQAPQSVDGGG
ncbi:MAG: L-threonylcarbamoyladenylate synthase [Parvularculaceae bacterium]